MAISVTVSEKALLGNKYFVWGTFSEATGGDDSNTITTGLNGIVANGFTLSTEAWGVRSSVSGGTITLYIEGATSDDTASGTWWAVGS